MLMRFLRYRPATPALRRAPRGLPRELPAVTVPELTAYFHLTLTLDGWIVLRCVPCQKPLLAATHLDLYDWYRKAAEHEARDHPDGFTDDGTDLDAGCARCRLPT